MFKRKPKFTRRQKAAMAGKIEMTLDILFSCMVVCFERGELDKSEALKEKYRDVLYAAFRTLREPVAPNDPEQIKREAHGKELCAKVLELCREEELPGPLIPY